MIRGSLALRENGWLRMSSQGNVKGYSDRETVKLDFDDITLIEVRKWARKTCYWFDLQGFMVLESSKNCYHVVFDRSVDWIENVSIMAWTVLQSQNQGLNKWFVMQCIKKCSTLRISSKGRKPAPRIVHRRGSQSHEVSNYLNARNLSRDWEEN